jgi:hypothetical protein
MRGMEEMEVDCLPGLRHVHPAVFGRSSRTCTHERIASISITTQAILLPDQRREELKSR